MGKDFWKDTAKQLIDNFILLNGWILERTNVSGGKWLLSNSFKYRLDK